MGNGPTTLLPGNGFQILLGARMRSWRSLQLLRRKQPRRKSMRAEQFATPLPREHPRFPCLRRVGPLEKVKAIFFPEECEMKTNDHDAPASRPPGQVDVREHRTLRERLAPGYRRELEQHELRTETHLDANWAPTLIHSLIEDAFSARASDIHIEPGTGGATVRFRIDGVVSDVARITPAEAAVTVNQLKAIANLDPVTSFLPRNAHASCALSSGHLDLRVALTPSQAGEAAAIRLLDSRRLQRSIDDLGLATNELQLV